MSGSKISVVKKWIDLGNNNFFGFLKLLPPPLALNLKQCIYCIKVLRFYWLFYYSHIVTWNSAYIVLRYWVSSGYYLNTVLSWQMVNGEDKI